VLDIYTMLPTESALDNDVLRQALLKRYEMTEEGFNPFDTEKILLLAYYTVISELTLDCRERNSAGWINPSNC